MLNFSTQKTMRLAQQLYEGVEVKGKGTIALISYLRTDSTRISEEADAAARSFIQEQYGTKYTASGDTTENKNSKAQDAHEAIRPTDVTNTPVMVKESLTRDLFRLYQLIWKRFVASRMQPAVYETISARINAGEYLFTAASSRLAFDGFMSVYTDPDEEKKEKTPLSGAWRQERSWHWKRWIRSSTSHSRRHTTPRHPLSKCLRNSASAVQVRMRRPSQRSSTAVTWQRRTRTFT